MRERDSWKIVMARPTCNVECGSVDLMPPLAEHGIRQKLKVTRLVYGLLGWEERPPPPPLSSSCSRQLLNDEERHQGQNNRIEAIVPVSIALAGAAAAPERRDDGLGQVDA